MTWWSIKSRWLRAQSIDVLVEEVEVERSGVESLSTGNGVKVLVEAARLAPVTSARIELMKGPSRVGLCPAPSLRSSVTAHCSGCYSYDTSFGRTRRA
jgi:hypothetical protein